MLALALSLLFSPAPLPGDFDAPAAAEVRALVLPAPAELTWEAIEWIPSFHAGLEAASEREMPVLLWVMNGHPLGCT